VFFYIEKHIVAGGNLRSGGEQRSGGTVKFQKSKEENQRKGSLEILRVVPGGGVWGQQEGVRRCFRSG